MLYGTYNSMLEISLCMDEFAMPPGHQDDQEMNDSWTVGYTPDSEEGVGS